MNSESHVPAVSPAKNALLHQEFEHVKDHWWWFLVLGIVLATCGTAALVFPAATVFTTFTVVVILGVSLMIGGIATIVASFWAGRWSGLLVQLLIGILYLMTGLFITERPAQATLSLTLFIAAMFIVAGAFRCVAALATRHTHWGWSLLNGVITLMLGVIIYRHFPEEAWWVIGVLVGVELLMQGFSWIMLSLAVRNIPAKTA